MPGVACRMRAMYSLTFLRGELAAFAGLGALGHFDFDLLGVNEIVGGDAKARRGDLLNFVCRGGFVAVGVGVFAAFAGIAAAAQMIHGQRESAMRFWAQRA